MSAARSAVCAALVLGLWAGAGASQTISRSVDAAADGAIVISMPAGDVTVRGWAQSRVEVSGTLSRAVTDVEVTRNGDEVSIRVITAPDAVEERGRGRRETELYVSVPADSSLDVTTASADILIAGVLGAQALRTASGDVETEHWAAQIVAESVGGDINVSGRGGAGVAQLSTVGGEIEVSGSFAELQADTASGDIELDVLDSRSMQLNTTNGEIEVHATLSEAAEISAETINGDVELEVGEEGNLSLDLATFSGTIENCFGLEAASSASGGPGSELRVNAGAGAPSVRVRTLNGDIEVCSS